MKKKVIVGVVSAVLAIGLIALLAFTLFAVRKVEVNFRTSRQNSTATEEEIVDAGDFDFGGSVFFINKSKYVERIENEFPYLNVINIEVVFPAKLVVHVAERQEVYAVEGEDGFYICDEEMKVLKISETFENTNENAMLLKGDFEVKNEKVGETLSMINPKIYQALVANNFSLAYAKELIKEIEITKQFDEALKTEIDVFSISLFGGQTVTIANPYNALNQKVHMFAYVYSHLFDMLGKTPDGSEVALDGENLKTCEIYVNNYYTEGGILNPNLEKCYFKIFVAQGV